jgi:hypothetical protein
VAATAVFTAFVADTDVAACAIVQVKDVTGEERDDLVPDDRDETWCLYDGELIDDE